MSYKQSTFVEELDFYSLMPSWFLSVKKGTWLRDEAVVFQIFKKEKKERKTLEGESTH